MHHSPFSWLATFAHGAAHKSIEYTPVQHTATLLVKMEKTAQTHAMLCDVYVNMQEF
jgi:hypothetical protein